NDGNPGRQYSQRRADDRRQVLRVARDEVGCTRGIRHVLPFTFRELVSPVDVRPPAGNHERATPRPAYRHRKMRPVDVHDIGPKAPEEIAELPYHPARAAILQADRTLSHAIDVISRPRKRYDRDVETGSREVIGPTLDMPVISPAD